MSTNPENNPPPAGNQPANQPAQNPPANSTTETVDVNAVVAKALAERDAKFAADFKQATGFDDLKTFTEHKLKTDGKLQELADASKAEAAHFKGQFHQTLVRSEILSSAGDALDPDTVHALLSSKAIVDDKGGVTIDGKLVKEAIAQLLKDKPFLAKPTGNQGSGTPHNTHSGVKQISRAEFEKMPASQRLAFIKADGVVTD